MADCKFDDGLENNRKHRFRYSLNKMRVFSKNVLQLVSINSLTFSPFINMHYISLITLAAVIPAALSRPIQSASDSLTIRDVGNEVIEARSVDVSDILKKRDYDNV